MSTRSMEYALDMAYSGAIQSPESMVVLVITDDGADVGFSAMIPRGWVRGGMVLEKLRELRLLLGVDDAQTRAGTIEADKGRPGQSKINTDPPRS